MRNAVAVLAISSLIFGPGGVRAQSDVAKKILKDPLVLVTTDTSASPKTFTRYRSAMPGTTPLSTTEYGNAFKASVLYLPNPAPQDGSDNIVFGPWLPIGGSKMFMTWKAGDETYFNGEKLFQSIGKNIYKIPDSTSIDSPLYADNPSQGTFRDWYAMQYDCRNHLSTNSKDTIPANQTSAQSLRNALNRFPWGHPTDPGHKVTDAEFAQLKQVYFQFISDHMKANFGSMIIPLTSVADPALGALATRADIMTDADYQAFQAGGAPKFTISPNLTTSTDGSGRTVWQKGALKAYYKMHLSYYFQQIPSSVNIPPTDPKLGPSAFWPARGPNAYETPMSLLDLAVPAATTNAANGDNNISSAIYAPAFEGTLLAAAPSTLVQQASVSVPGWDVPAPVPYFQKVDGQDFYISSDDLTKFSNQPGSTSNLIKSFAPLPTTYFTARHADRGNVLNLVEVMDQNLGANDKNLIRQAAMQVFIKADISYKIWNGSTPPSGADSTVTVWDDTYVFVDDNVSQVYKTAKELNDALQTGAVRGGGNLLPGRDPLDRSPVPTQRMVRVTPAASDATITQAGLPTDTYMSYYPDTRIPSEAGFLATVRRYSAPPEAGNPTSYGNAFVQAVLGRGPAFNYVYDKDGARIDPTRQASPITYWANPRHVAIVWPYQVPDDAGINGGNPITVGPYVLNLDSLGANASADYVYAFKPHHQNSQYPNGGAQPATDADSDNCTPVVINDELRTIVNALYESQGTVQLHMTVDTAKEWGKPVAGNAKYRYAACLTLATAASTDSAQSLILRVALHTEDGGQETAIPCPQGFIPLLPTFPTYQGNVPTGMQLKTGLSMGGDPQFVAAYDTRLHGNGAQQSARGLQTITAQSLDTTVQIGAVSGCGVQIVIESDVLSCASTASPSCFMHVCDTGNANAEYTAGLPISPALFILGNNDVNQFTASSPSSVSSRLDGNPALKDAVRAALLKPTVDGANDATLAPLFRPADGGQVVTKGHACRLEFSADCQVPPGLNFWDFDPNNPLQAARPTFANRRYASFIRSMVANVFAPGQDPAAGVPPERKVDLFQFLNTDFGTNAVPMPPAATLEYVFREATDPMPGARHYTIQVLITDVSGGTRTLLFPVWVRDEGSSIDKLNQESQKK